jgi:hypothetical protein
VIIKSVQISCNTLVHTKSIVIICFSRKFCFVINYGNNIFCVQHMFLVFCCLPTDLHFIKFRCHLLVKWESTFFIYLPSRLKLYSHVELAALNMLHQTRPCVESIKNSQAFGSPSVLRPWATHTSHTLCRLPSSSDSKSSRSYPLSSNSLFMGRITLLWSDRNRMFGFCVSVAVFRIAPFCNVVKQYVVMAVYFWNLLQWSLTEM